MTEVVCDEVCEKLTDINNALVHGLITSITDLLKEINTSIELSGKVDEQVLIRLAKLEAQLEDLAQAVTLVPTRAEDLRRFLDVVAAELGYVLPDDKIRLRVLIRRLGTAAASWSDEEKNTIIDTFENLGCSVVAVRKKLRRLYWLIASAGVVTLLSQVGAPSWIQKLFSLVAGQ